MKASIRHLVPQALTCAALCCSFATGNTPSFGIATTDNLLHDFPIPSFPDNSLPPTTESDDTQQQQVEPLAPPQRTILNSIGTFTPGNFVAYQSNQNGRAGAVLLDAGYKELNPQKKRSTHPHRAEMLDVIDTYLLNDDKHSANELAAHVAGAGVANLGIALNNQLMLRLDMLRHLALTAPGVPSCLSTSAADIPSPASASYDAPYITWGQAEMDYTKLSATNHAPGYSLDSFGGSAGFAALSGRNLTFGASLTGLSGKLSSKGYGSNASGHMDSWYAGVFMRLDSGCWQHILAGTAGWADIRFRRSVYLPTGYRTHGDTSGLALGLLYELSHSFPIDEQIMKNASWQPILNIAFRHSKIDSYTESGSDAALHVASHNHVCLTFGLGSRLNSALDESFFNIPVDMYVQLLAKATAGDTRGSTETSFPDIRAQARVHGAEQGRYGLELATGVDFTLGAEHSSLFAVLSGSIYTDYAVINGTLGYRFRF